REFAAHRLAGLNVRILGASVAAAVLRGAIERALKGGAAVQAPADRAPTADEIHRTINDLSESARRVMKTAGVAVYVKAPGQVPLRAAVTWMSDAPMPDSPPHIPRVFELVLESRDAVVFPDLAAHPGSGVSRSAIVDAIRGLVAVPIISGSQTIGM